MYNFGNYPKTLMIKDKLYPCFCQNDLMVALAESGEVSLHHALTDIFDAYNNRVLELTELKFSDENMLRNLSSAYANKENFEEDEDGNK